jgi:hypothetical protein
MPNPMIRIHNTETNEIVDREMTNAEYENYKAELIDFAEKVKTPLV